MNVKEMIAILEPLPEDMPVEICIQSLSVVKESRHKERLLESQGVRKIQFVGIEGIASPHKDSGAGYEEALCFYIEENNRNISDGGFEPTYRYREMMQEIKLQSEQACKVHG